MTRSQWAGAGPTKKTFTEKKIPIYIFFPSLSFEPMKALRSDCDSGLNTFFGYIVDPPVNQRWPPSFLPKFNFVITVWWSHVWKKLRNSDRENHCWLDRMSDIGRIDSYLHSLRYIERVKGVRSITVWFLSSSPRRWWSVSSIPIRLQAKTPHSLLQRVESCDIALSIFNINILKYILNIDMLKMMNVSSTFSLSALQSKTC